MKQMKSSPGYLFYHISYLVTILICISITSLAKMKIIVFNMKQIKTETIFESQNKLSLILLKTKLNVSLYFLS